MGGRTETMGAGAVRVLLAAWVALAACGADSDESGRYWPDPGGELGCTRDADCATGLVCSAEGRCVADDGLPPEQVDPRTARRPSASAAHLYVLAPDGDAVTLIDAERLGFEWVPVPADPVDLAVLPGEDAALVLSRDGRAVSLLSRRGGTISLQVQRTDRRFGALALAPDGRWALLWTPDGELPDAGAEGLVGLVDVAALQAGEPVEQATYAAGRRHTSVHFRLEGDRAADAVVVGRSELAVFALGAEDPGPLRVQLPPLFAEVATREVVAAPDGSWLLLRSLAAAELAVFDVESRTLATVPLPGPASDLALTDDGSLAVAVLRSTGQVAVLPLPAALTDPGSIRISSVELPATGCAEPPCTASPGQVALAPDGSWAALFSNAAATESFAIFTPADGTFSVFDRLEKRVQTVALSPDGGRAVVLHRADPTSTAADPYERAVDRSEGYSLVALESGLVQLKLTGTLVPQEVVFAPGDRYAGVPLRDDATGAFGFDGVDLEALVTDPLPLASAPVFAGPLPAPTPDLAHRIWVTQAHRAGRIGIARLDARTIRHVTGFELNAEVR